MVKYSANLSYQIIIRSELKKKDNFLIYKIITNINYYKQGKINNDFFINQTKLK